MIGIYKITNIINGISYIGQSKNIDKRWKQHINDSNRVYPLSKISNSIKNDGIDNFKFEVIEECLENELEKREKFWIRQSTNNLYNIVKYPDCKPLPKEFIKNDIRYIILEQTEKRYFAELHSTITDSIVAYETGRIIKNHQKYYMISNEDFGSVDGEVCLNPDNKIKCYNIFLENR